MTPEEAQELGELFAAVSSVPHTTFVVKHNRNLGFDTSIWTVESNGKVYSDLDLLQAFRKAKKGLLPD
jgi:hypothetical protein